MVHTNLSPFFKWPTNRLFLLNCWTPGSFPDFYMNTVGIKVLAWGWEWRYSGRITVGSIPRGGLPRSIRPFILNGTGKWPTKKTFTVPFPLVVNHFITQYRCQVELDSPTSATHPHPQSGAALGTFSLVIQ